MMGATEQIKKNIGKTIKNIEVKKRLFSKPHKIIFYFTDGSLLTLIRT